MKLPYKVSLFFYLLLTCGIVQGQNSPSLRKEAVLGDTAIFRFAPQDQMFLAAYKGNNKAINSFSRLIRKHRSSIESGNVQVRVLGFCSSFNTFQENLSTAKDRSNQVKSFFIVHEGLKEEHFRTSNSTRQWQGNNDIITITYLFRTNNASSQTLTEPEQETISTNDTEVVLEEKEENTDNSSYSQNETNKNVSPPHGNITPVVSKKIPSLQWAVKTNVAYLAATVANIGVEVGFGKHFSIDIPFIYSPYTVARDYRLRFLAVQPEFRYWLQMPLHGHFFGAHFNIGAFNIAVDNKTRYQSEDGFYGVGISYGYMLPFARHWAAQFSIGAGYVHTKYDAFYNIPNGACFKKNSPYNYWGITKLGIELVYTFGK